MPEIQPRVQMGRPEGGQFSVAEREADALESLDMDADGTFFFPPRLRTPDEVVEFWTQVRVPDVALRRVRTANLLAYEHIVENWPVADWEDEYRGQWLERHPEPDKPGLMAGKNHPRRVWEAELEAERERVIVERREFWAGLRGEIPAGDERTLVRVIGMYRSGRSEDFSEPQMEEIRSIQVETSDGSKTATEFARQYPAFRSINHRPMFLEMQPEDDPAVLGARIQSLEEMDRSISGQVDGVARQIEGLGHFIDTVDRVNNAQSPREVKKIAKDAERRNS
ncbi:hypothetical protein [Aeromicrobium sp. CTD01-1L150]|uniref:hypothetical protein n=1 Tax=Aeromicrobium sp. CTD01-1L150 TaxID=3341830 RepID=UPI0035C2035A